MDPRADWAGGVRRGSLWLPRRTLGLALLALALAVAAGFAPETLVYDRAAVGAGQWWRLVSGHWVHGDPEHLAWDVAALLLLGALVEARRPGQLIPVLVAGTAGVDAWLWWGAPEMARYCGLSGILNAALAFLLAELWRSTRSGWVVAVAVGAVLKVLAENAHGALVSETVWPSVPMAHGAGLAAGALWAGWAAAARRRRGHHPGRRRLHAGA